MLRYALDNLGWSDFERLIQALLKVQLGLGVEAWGGSGDFGRDAFFSGTLDYPTKGCTGSFVFQAKFVDAANAAGAKPHALVQAAAAKEAMRISRRCAAGEPPPTHYAFFTNAPCQKKTRTAIEAALAPAFLGAVVDVHIHDGADVCTWLDTAPNLARAFPTILGFRDLEELLRSRVDREVFERSQAALDGAADLARVFVPTATYYRALEAVGRNAFVVLSGPPEAGKTAIGRMMCLAQHARGWEAIECRDPEEILRLYESNRHQCFFADDFFGRTEFDPQRARRWEAELPHVLRRMNENHWLLLTSRAHILHQGERKIDVDAEIAFPKASEVLVDASALTREEKARILYRHAKEAGLPDESREATRLAAWHVSGIATYTAERVRRLVADVKTGAMRGEEAVRAAAEKSFRNPTEKSQKTFRALPESHKWFLYAMLECDGDVRQNNKQSSRYTALCPPVCCGVPERIEADLVDSFLSADTASWSHPSYRDVAIDELAAEPPHRAWFLRTCGIDGVRLAVSWLGGATGARRLPLLVTDTDWNTLSERAVELGRSGHDVLSVLVDGRKVGRGSNLILKDQDARLTSIIEEVRLVSTAHNAPGDTGAQALDTFLAIDDGRGVPVNWDARASAVAAHAIEHLKTNYVPWQAVPPHQRFARLVDTAKKCGVDVRPSIAANQLVRHVIVAMVFKFDKEDIEWDGYSWESGEDARDAAREYQEQTGRLRYFAEIATLAGLTEAAEQLIEFCSGFTEQGDSLEEKSHEIARQESDPDDDEKDMRDRAAGDFGEDEVDELFSDL